MKKMSVYKCPFCNKQYRQKQSLYDHMEEIHKEQLNGLPAAQVFFNYTYNKQYGLCIVCKKNYTKFNLIKERYERICENPECKKKYHDMFVQRMKKRYGNDVYSRMKDPNVQKDMLSKRKISGTYTWSSNNKFKFTYTGSYEKEFLEFMDIFLNWSPEDLFAPSPITIPYEYQGKKHFYISDFFIPSLNLIIECKSFENKHYREREIEIEKIKDNAVIKEGYNYFKVHDKTYDDFFEYLMKLIQDINSGKIKIPNNK